MAIPITIGIVGAVLGLATLSMQFVPPLKRASDYTFNKLLPNRLQGVIESLQMRQRGIITQAEYYDYLRSEGFETNQADFIYEAGKQLLSAEAELIMLWRSENAPKDALSNKAIYLENMERLGFNNATAERFEKARQFYPTPSDLVSWQAREVFEPDSVKRYGLDNELELIEREAFYKAGMNDEQIRNFWRAHWQHPSITTVFDMLHRTTFDRPSDQSSSAGQIGDRTYFKLLEHNEVQDYFRLVEIPPFWRKRLIELSFNPYTRVDLRRMYNLGILTQEQVFKGYLDLGYDEEKAQALTIFAVVNNMPKERDLTRTMVEKAFEIGEIELKEFKQLLIALGYDSEESDVIISIKQHKLDSDELDDKIATIKAQFVRGINTEEITIDLLDKLNLKSSYRDRLVAQIIREKQAQFKLPNKEDLLKWFTTKLIDIDLFSAKMELLGFREQDIQLYIKSVSVT